MTLDEIAQMIKVGEEVTIIDNETKEDLTSVTLTQIIFEEEKRESRMPLSNAPQPHSNRRRDAPGVLRFAR